MTDKPRVWITRKLSDNTEARAREHYDVVLNPDDRLSSADDIVRISAEVDAIIPCHSESFDADTVKRLDSRLKIVANHSVGVDHCDLNALKQKGICVTNTPDVLSDATAEIAMLLLLGAARRAPEGDAMIRNGNWDSWSPSFMVGTEVTGKRLGILGMGRVGQAMAKKARGFDMVIHYHNRKPLNAAQEHGAIYHDTIESLLPHCDFLSLHSPATDDTRNIINQKTIDLLPQGAILVNTARGALVNENDLLKAISTGKLGAAGLDCFATEPGGNAAFAEHKNVFMLPHIGSATRETRDAMGFRALDNLDAFFAGREPRDKLV